MKTLNTCQAFELSAADMKAVERNSILAVSAGAMGDVTLTDSAVIILYAGMLGAGDMFSLVTTAMLPLFNGLFIIPMALLAARMGKRGLILKACALAFCSYLVVVAAPFFGAAAVPVLILMLIAFAIFHTGFMAAWFPLIDTFLSKERRNAYLGKMRFSWQASVAVFIFIIGLCIGKNPPLWQLQLVLLIAALIYSGRIFFASRIPDLTTKDEEEAPKQLREGLSLALRNKPLTGYSVYLFVLNLAAYGTLPLMTIYLKRHLNAPDNIIVFISSITLVGMLLGSLCAGKIINRFGIRKTFLAIHVTYALINGIIFFIGKDTMNPFLTYAVIAALLLIYSFTFANANIASTSEMMALANPGNKVMAMAFCGAFYYGGLGLSRLVTSLVLGSGLLAPEWHIGALNFCHYQTIFGVYSVVIVFAAMLLVVVPAIFPEGEYVYSYNDR